VDHFISLSTHILKISITYLQYLKGGSQLCSICPPFAAVTKASRFQKYLIASSIKSVRRKHVYLWHHEWRHKEYLTWTILQRISFFIVSGSYLWHLRSTSTRITKTIVRNNVHGGPHFLCATLYYLQFKSFSCLVQNMTSIIGQTQKNRLISATIHKIKLPTISNWNR